MLDLELELVRHITSNGYDALRPYNLRSELYDLDDKERNPNVVNVQSLLSWLHDFFDEHKGSPSNPVMFSEFPWLVEDKYQESPETEIDYLAQKIRNRYAKTLQRRQLRLLANASPEEYARLYTEGSRKIYNAVADNTFVIRGDDVFGVVEYQKKRVEESKTLGVSLGFKAVTDWTGGVRPGHLAVLAALPKRFKTWFLIKAYLEQAMAGEAPVLFTLELSKEEITGRILCLISGVPYTRYYRGELMPNEWKAIESAAKVFARYRGAIVESPLGDRFVSSLLYEAERYEATSIIVDQFSFLQWSGNHFKENEGYKEIVYDIKNACLTYDLPWYMAAQLNRQSVEDDEFPIAQHLGLTRALEEASDLIMGIKSNDALREENQAMLGVVEARHCEAGPKARWTVQYEFRNKTEFETHEV